MDFFFFFFNKPMVLEIRVLKNKQQTSVIKLVEIKINKLMNKIVEIKDFILVFNFNTLFGAGITPTKIC